MKKKKKRYKRIRAMLNYRMSEYVCDEARKIVLQYVRQWHNGDLGREELSCIAEIVEGLGMVLTNVGRTLEYMSDMILSPTFSPSDFYRNFVPNEDEEGTSESDSETSSSSSTSILSSASQAFSDPSVTNRKEEDPRFSIVEDMHKKITNADLLRRPGRFLVTDDTVRLNPLVLLHLGKRVAVYYIEHDRVTGQWVFYGYSLLFDPIDKGSVIPFYELSEVLRNPPQ